jgi:hypothetical protein
LIRISIALEAVGLAASIAAIAQRGLNIAIKMITFAETVHAAEESARRVSSEISVTCGIL